MWSLGTFYGGDGKSTFALPDLQGSVPLGQGQGPGITQRFLGEAGGNTTVTLLTQEMPQHNHIIQGSFEDGTLKVPAPMLFLGRAKSGTIYQSNRSANLVQMNSQEFSIAGSSLPHQNMQPYLTLTYIIALQGVFPPRS